MRVFVTGINGFVGRYLKDELERASHTVYGLDNCADTFSDKTFSADIRDYKKIQNIILNTTPEIIVHLAAISLVDYKNIDNIYDVNINGTLNILKVCVSANIVIPLIFVSSSQVYGNNILKINKLINEECKVSPVNHYGSSKASAENIALAFHYEKGLPLTIVRPFNHTGCGQSEKFVVPKIVNAFKNGDKTIDLGNITTVRDYLDVRDVVAAYRKLIEIFHDGQIFNVSSEKHIEIVDIINRLQVITGHIININTVEKHMRRNEIHSSVGDSKKIRKSLNWIPKYDFNDTLRWMMSSK